MKTILPDNPADRCLLVFKRLLLTVAAALVLAAMGCKHTAHGVGEDMQKAGEKIQEKTR